MPESPKPLIHQDAEKKDDEVLVRESRSYLVAAPPLQLTAELLTKLRSMNLLWWSPEKLRSFVPSSERMRWLSQRPDIRQKITSTLTGLAPKAARKKSAEFQAGLIDSVIDDGDTTVRAFEDAFEPKDMSIYGPARKFWQHFRQQTPWDQKSAALQELMGWLLKALLADKSSLEGIARQPILTSWQVRTSIEGSIWHTHMPLEIRIAIDDARFSREKSDPSKPFHAIDDLAIALPNVIATHIAPKDLLGVLDTAERVMGFAETEAMRERDKSIDKHPEAATGTRQSVHPDAKRAEKAEAKTDPKAEAKGDAKGDGKTTEAKPETKSVAPPEARPSGSMAAAAPADSAKRTDNTASDHDTGKHAVAAVAQNTQPDATLASGASANENPRASSTNESAGKVKAATPAVTATPAATATKGKPGDGGAAATVKNPNPTSGVMQAATPAGDGGKPEKSGEKTGKGIMLGAALGLADENDELQAFIDMVDGGDDEDDAEEETFPRLEIPVQARTAR